MKIAPFPPEEILRIKELQSYGILDSENEKEYDDLVELASQICECPTALITFVDKERQWFKASKNADKKETPRDIAFCSHTILQNDVMIVTDAKADERFADNPLVTGDVQIGFYAGAPIYSSSGFKLGSVCVIDHIKKNELSDKQKNALTIIARQVSKLLELRVTNTLIIKHTEAQIEAEKRISQLIIAESDKKDNLIAYELHENLAQGLAAIKLFLESANKSKDLESYFVKKSIAVITLIIDEVRSLSKSIIPTTMLEADYYWIIREYGVQFGKQHHINVKFGQPAIIKGSLSNMGLNLFRVVQNQLEIAKISGAKEIFIDIISDAEMLLDISYDTNGKEPDFSTIQLQNNITTRVELLNGVATQKNDPEKNYLSVKLPLTKN